jgi:PAS domain S-box-containing protein
VIFHPARSAGWAELTLPNVTRIRNLALCLLLAVASLAVPTMSFALEKLRVASELDYAPYLFLNENGQADGFSADLMKALAKHMNFEVEFIAGPWPANRQKLDTGEVDVLPLMAISEDRASLVNFTDSYVTAYDSIFVRKSENKIQSEGDLADKTIIVQRSDLAHDYLERNRDLLGAKIVTVDTLNEGFKLLSSGEGDALVCSQIVGHLTINQLQIRNVAQVSRPLIKSYTREFAIAVRKDSGALEARLNEGLKTVMASGEYRQIYEKWFSDLDPNLRNARERSEFQRSLIAVVLLALTIAIISVGFVFVFKREVRRQARKLSETEDRFQNLVANLPGAVISVKLGSDRLYIDYISDGIEAITGYPAADFMQKKRTLKSLIHPADFESVMHAAGERLRTQRRGEIDFRLISKDGETKWIHSRATVQKSCEGQIVGLEGILLDVTDSRRVSDLLAEHQSKMAASARLSALGEMAAGVAHEVNNPLAIINLRLHQLLQIANRGPIEPEVARGIASSIEFTTHRIARIIKSLQAVARESQDDPFEKVTLNAIFEETFELCHQRMLKKGIEISMEPFPENLSLECRRVQISQVLINLFNNAFDAVVDQKERFVRIAVRDLHGSVEISVSNSGPGIPIELREKIFQPFFTTKGVGKGMGLGLSISKGLIEGHRGELWLDHSSLYTRFVIVLPKLQMNAQHPLQSGDNQAIAETGPAPQPETMTV